ncbi:SphA family protein [Acinetobacter pragensis]|uniref:SphA family protein n=1 Tax=Acinetobacter pragensis TaxID=1806892 RepID=UPI0033407AB3
MLKKAIWTILIGSLTTTVFATEGGIGRPITGMQVQPLNGLLPVEEGGVLTLSSIYYDGNFERSRTVPIAGELTGGLNYDVSYNFLNSIFVWKTNEKWSLATAVGVPVQYTKVGAYLNNFETEQSSTKIGDVMFSPLMVNYHLNPIMHALFNVAVYAPTGSYDADQLSNAGQNTWTFVPNLAFTTILPRMNAEITTNLAYEFYTKNDATDYTNGDIFRLDVLGLKRFGELGGDGLGVGAVFGWIEQTTDDKGKLAERLDGFRGKALGAGPILTYDKKLSKTAGISASFRGIYEFDVQNRPEGEAYQFAINYQY